MLRTDHFSAMRGQICSYLPGVEALRILHLVCDEVEIAAIEEALDKLLADRFTREERMMLEGQVRR